MSATVCEAKSTAEEQSDALTPPVTEPVNTRGVEDLDSGEETVDNKDNRTEKQESKNSLDELDTEGEDGDSISPCATVVPSNTPVTGDSGHVSPTMESSLESLSDGTQQQQDPDVSCNVNNTVETVAAKVTATFTSSASILSKEDTNSSPSSAKTKTVKEYKKEDKKKSKKKDDKSGEHILRALNSLQSPEEKLAALCRKFAELHDEHRVLQASFKTQQRTLTVVVREKEQLQSEHTKAMMAKGKLESLCRELQKHNKVIENESIKRTKESEEKRKEISAHFSSTISDIQSQMTDNSEKNNILRKENENLAEQLRSFMVQCQARDEHVKKLQEQHELENKLAAAKLAHAEAIIREVEERSNKEKELMLLKLTEMTKKAQLTESQLGMYKSKYEEFNDLHTRSSETFQKYKMEMDKMTKRIKRLEKDGLQWKTKWEASSKTLLEQYEAKSKSEQEAAVCAQKVKKLESLCRALQVELHRKKVVSDDKVEANAQPTSPVKVDTPASTVPPNSPEASSSGESSPALSGPHSSKKAASSTDLPSATSSASELSACSPPASSNVPEAAAVTTITECTSQSCSVKGLPSASRVSDTDVGFGSCEGQTSSKTTMPLSPLTTAASLSVDEANQQEAAATPLEVTACDDCMPKPLPSS